MAESMKVYIDGVEQKVNAFETLKFLLDVRTGKKKLKEIEK